MIATATLPSAHVELNSDEKVATKKRKLEEPTAQEAGVHVNPDTLQRFSGIVNESNVLGAGKWLEISTTTGRGDLSFSKMYAKGFSSSPAVILSRGGSVPRFSNGKPTDYGKINSSFHLHSDDEAFLSQVLSVCVAEAKRKCPETEGYTFKPLFTPGCSKDGKTYESFITLGVDDSKKESLFTCRDGSLASVESANKFNWLSVKFDVETFWSNRATRTAGFTLKLASAELGDKTERSCNYMDPALFSFENDTNFGAVEKRKNAATAVPIYYSASKEWDVGLLLPGNKLSVPKFTVSTNEAGQNTHLTLQVTDTDLAHQLNDVQTAAKDVLVENRAWMKGSQHQSEEVVRSKMYNLISDPKFKEDGGQWDPLLKLGLTSSTVIKDTNGSPVALQDLVGRRLAEVRVRFTSFFFGSNSAALVRKADSVVVLPVA